MKQMTSKVANGLGDVAREQIHREFSEATQGFLDQWYGREADGFIQTLMNEAVKKVQVPTAYTEDCAKHNLQLLRQQNASFKKKLLDRSKKSERVLGVFAHQLLPILLRSRLQYRKYVEDDRAAVKKVIGVGESYTAYLDTKKKAIGDLLVKGLQELLTQLANLYQAKREKKGKVEFADMQAVVTEHFESIEKSLEGILSDNSFDQMLWDAAEKGDLPQCYKAIALGANTGFQNKRKAHKTPLHVAAEEGHSEIVSFFLNLDSPVLKVDANATDSHGRTPLFLSVVKQMKASSKLSAIVAALCDHGADPNLPSQGQEAMETNWRGWTPLQILCFSYEAQQDLCKPNLALAIIETLLQHGADLNIAIGGSRWTSTIGATPYGKVRNFFADSTGVQGWTGNRAAGTSAISKTRERVGRWTPNLVAVPYDTAKSLVTAPLAQDYAGKTSLHFAAARTSLPLVRLLLQFGPAFDVEDANGRRPIDYAAKDSEIYSVINEAMQQGPAVAPGG